MEEPDAEDLGDLYEVLRDTLELGQADVLSLPGSPARTAWALRRRDADILRIRGNPNCRLVQGIGCFPIQLPSGVEVKVVAVLIGMGLPPLFPDDHFAAIINEYGSEQGGLVENLTIQDMTPLIFIGETAAGDCMADVPNSLRQSARSALREISSVQAWTEADFEEAVAIFRQQYPTKMSLWDEYHEQHEQN